MRVTSTDLYAYFHGYWTFSRTMLGAKGLQIGDADGEAEFQPASFASVLHYKESGHLRLIIGERMVSFSRRFDYTFFEDEVDVKFADGMQAGQNYQRYHYDPERKVLLPAKTHLCVLDHYNGSYTLRDDDHFDMLTRIEGPHKDYAVQTHFARQRSAMDLPTRSRINAVQA